MNRKGFMMAELVVVSAIVLTTVATFYTSYNKIYSAYKTKLQYYDVTTLYKLASYRNSEDLTTFSEEYNLIQNNDGEKVYLIKNGPSLIDKTKLSDINPTFSDYIDFFNNTVDYKNFPSDYMIMERCTKVVNGQKKEDCYYAYLEVIY